MHVGANWTLRGKNEDDIRRRMQRTKEDLRHERLYVMGLLGERSRDFSCAFLESLEARALVQVTDSTCWAGLCARCHDRYDTLQWNGRDNSSSTTTAGCGSIAAFEPAESVDLPPVD